MRSRRLHSLLILVVLALGGLPVAAGGEVFLSKREALELAFPDAEVREKTVLLDDHQYEAVKALARRDLETRLVTLYTGVRDGEVTGYAFIDLHTVRTLPEAFLVVLEPDGRVRSLHILAFYEPPEYRPMDRWLGQFDGRELDSKLRIGGEIHGIAGSTLSARAVTGGVRRSLAFYRVLVAPELQPATPPTLASDPPRPAPVGGL